MDFNNIICGDCAKVLTGFPAGCIDLTVTSPPYDNLRDYNGYTFDFEPIAQQLWRVTKPGGVVVWVVGDATVNGSETGTSFRQALGFMEVGFNLHDTMIWNKQECAFPNHTRYASVFEYMFIFSKDAPRSFNPIQCKNVKSFGRKNTGTDRKANGKTRKSYTKPIKRTSNLYNVWVMPPHKSRKMDQHPAIFPEALARDHIISWSNPGDIVLDPMCGSGTTLKMAKEQSRQFIGIDISQEYCDLARRRVEGAKVPLFVMPPEPNGKAEPEQLELVSSGL